MRKQSEALLPTATSIHPRGRSTLLKKKRHSQRGQGQGPNPVKMKTELRTVQQCSLISQTKMETLLMLLFRPVFQRYGSCSTRPHCVGHRGGGTRQPVRRGFALASHHRGRAAGCRCSFLFLILCIKVFNKWFCFPGVHVDKQNQFAQCIANLTSPVSSDEDPRPHARGRRPLPTTSPTASSGTQFPMNTSSAEGSAEPAGKTCHIHFFL